uniref:Heat shock protein family A (Hsp70) member 12B n=1 Tax=Phasianus colchicus TaxID=9054 RepID=A0A669PIN4_PHACC
MKPCANWSRVPSGSAGSSPMAQRGSALGGLCPHPPALPPSPWQRSDAHTAPSFAVVVAIDFGTTSSGYGFSFCSDPEAIHMMRKWEGGDPGVANQKTPTCLLLTPSGAFHSFGYAARDAFHRLQPEEAQRWLYFDKFKMKIHGSSVRAGPAALHGGPGGAKTGGCRAGTGGHGDGGGIKGKGGLWRGRGGHGGTGGTWGLGDWGGWREWGVIGPDPGLPLPQRPECHPETPIGAEPPLRARGPPDPPTASPGGPCGAVGVDVAFEQLLCRIFGADFMASFKAQRPAAWVDLSIAFEARKRAAAPSRCAPVNISLPFSFIDFYRRHRGHSVETALRRSDVKLVKWSSQGMLRVSAEAMSELFQPTVTSIVQHIDALLKRPEVRGVKFLFLVGGFAESAVLQRAVQAALGTACRVLIPQDAGLSILKGAVLFGLDPTALRVRRSPLTYGVGVLNKFIEGKHPREKLLLKDGRRWCSDVFEKFVCAEQSVALGEVVQRSYCPARSGQRRTVINIYSCARDDVLFITEPGVRKCGTVSLELPELGGVGERREIRASMQFGDAEIKVTAVDVSSARTVRATIDFLSD